LNPHIVIEEFDGPLYSQVLDCTKIRFSFSEIYQPDIQFINRSFGKLPNGPALAANFEISGYPLATQRLERRRTGTGINAHLGKNIQEKAFVQLRKLFYQGKLHGKRRFIRQYLNFFHQNKYLF
jgi:hypothetical protein